MSLFPFGFTSAPRRLTPPPPPCLRSLDSKDCSSKAAALSFHEGLTEELRHLYVPHSNARAIRTSVICPAHFKSGMFAGFVSGIPEFLAPSLEIDTVAELVEQTILSGESQVSGYGPASYPFCVGRIRARSAVTPRRHEYFGSNTTCHLR